jgi:hypothetical protein
VSELTTIRKQEINRDFEVRSLDTIYSETLPRTESLWSYTKFLVTGILFGIILVKSEVISWFRIQEMFRLQSFHMYGVIGSAVLTGIISVQLIKRFNIKALNGEKIELQQKKFNKGQIYGGLLFDLDGRLPEPAPVQCLHKLVQAHW